jgi:pSer/pThr/pTyr-binding forkhead associated (FHA) protein
VQLSQGTILTIGRSPASDIVLADPEISRSHAIVELRTDGVWVKDLGSGNGTHIDGQRITSRLWESGQTLQLGRAQFELRRGDNPAPAIGQRAAESDRATGEQETAQRVIDRKETPANSLRIAWHIKTPLKAGKEHAITVPTGTSLTVGRDPKSDIVLDDPSVSRRHTKIITHPDGARVQDLNSQNGTTIEGNRISDGHWIIGQILEIGDFAFSLEISSDDSAYERGLSVRNLRKRKHKKIGSVVIERLRVFVSYSRRDIEAADRLAAALEKKGFEVIVDRRDLPYGEQWQRELADFVRISDTVLFLVSTHSVASQWCKWELAQVTEHRKRLFPLAIDLVAVEDLPEEISKVHILPQKGLFDLDKHLSDLVQALNTDRAWVKEHVRLVEWAREWRARGKPAAMLLRGPALEAAHIWKAHRPKREKPAEAILELIVASRHGRVRRWSTWAAAGGVAMLAGVGLLAAWMNFGPPVEAAQRERQAAVEQGRKEREQRETAERERQAAAEQGRKELEQREEAERERQKALTEERQREEERRRTAALERWQRAPDGAVVWSVRNSTSRKLRLKFFSQDREGIVWPAHNRAWELLPTQRFPYKLGCKLGETICYGAFAEDGANNWGVGRSGKEGCKGCCGTCGASELTFNLVE